MINWTTFGSLPALGPAKLRARSALSFMKTQNGGRIDWIDFRIVGFDTGVPVPIQLHLSPRGQFSMGTFAYQLIRRGEKHGIRLLGTLKKGEDVNVLAI
jgi:hypothetical protein